MATLASVTEEMADRRAKVESLVLRGWTPRAIAQKLGVSPTTIYRDIKAVRDQWKVLRVRDYDAALSEQLEKLIAIEREAWDAWDRSKQEEVRTKVIKEGESKTSEGRQEAENTNGNQFAAGKHKAERATASQTGDLRYLELVIKCIDRRCKMQGLDDPMEHLVRDSYTVAVRELNDEELSALAKLRERLANSEAQCN